MFNNSSDILLLPAGHAGQHSIPDLYSFLGHNGDAVLATPQVKETEHIDNMNAKNMVIPFV